MIVEIKEVEGHGKSIRCARYYNSNGIGTAIVAVANYFDGKLFDWAAYIGGSERGAEREEWAIEDVARRGCKMMWSDAQHFFPALPISKYRV